MADETPTDAEILDWLEKMRPFCIYLTGRLLLEWYSVDRWTRASGGDIRQAVRNAIGGKYDE